MTSERRSPNEMQRGKCNERCGGELAAIHGRSWNSIPASTDMAVKPSKAAVASTARISVWPPFDGLRKDRFLMFDAFLPAARLASPEARWVDTTFSSSYVNLRPALGGDAAVKVDVIEYWDGDERVRQGRLSLDCKRRSPCSP